MSFQIVYNSHQLAQTLPQRLYKFRRWNHPYHNDVLEKQQLFLSTPEKLWEVGDDRDCRFPIEFPSTYSEHLNVLSAIADKPEWKNLSPSDKQKARQQLAHHWSTPEGKVQFSYNYYDSQNKIMAVLSMTGRFDNIEMWKSSYGNFADGFCVGIDPSHCANEFMANLIIGGRCNYVSENTPPLSYKSYALHGANASIQMKVEHMFMKYDRFQFEEEYRLVKQFYPSIYPKGFTLSDQYLNVPKSAFREVTVGYLMSQRCIDEIIDVCRKQHLHVLIYIAWPYNGGITRQLIGRT